MKQIRRAVRFSRLLTHIGTGMLITTWFAGIRRKPATDPGYRRAARWWLGNIVHIVGGRVTVVGEPAPQGSLLVANHVSWLDIPLLGGSAPIYFLSKEEVRRWPVIGWLAASAGTLFIKRGGSGASERAAATIAGRLAMTGNVLVFPEGTTTNGRDVRRFHARIFAGAQDASALVQPVAVRYLNAAGEHHPMVAYLDKQTLLNNLWGIIGEPAVHIEISFLAPVPSQNYSRRELALYAEQQVRAVVAKTAPVLDTATPLEGQTT